MSNKDKIITFDFERNIFTQRCIYSRMEINKKKGCLCNMCIYNIIFNKIHYD